MGIIDFYKMSTSAQNTITPRVIDQDLELTSTALLMVSRNLPIRHSTPSLPLSTSSSSLLPCFSKGQVSSLALLSVVPSRTSEAPSTSSTTTSPLPSPDLLDSSLLPCSTLPSTFSMVKRCAMLHPTCTSPSTTLTTSTSSSLNSAVTTELLVLNERTMCEMVAQLVYNFTNNKC